MIPVVFALDQGKKVPITEYTNDYELVGNFLLHPVFEKGTQRIVWFRVTHQPSGWAVANFESKEIAKGFIEASNKIRGWKKTATQMGEDPFFIYNLQKLILEHGGWWLNDSGEVAR